MVATQPVCSAFEVYLFTVEGVGSCGQGGKEWEGHGCSCLAGVGGAGGWPAASWSAECVWGRLSYARNQPCGFDHRAWGGTLSFILATESRASRDKGNYTGPHRAQERTWSLWKKVPWGVTESPRCLILESVLPGLGIVRHVSPAHSDVPSKTGLSDKTNGEYMAVLTSKL